MTTAKTKMIKDRLVQECVDSKFQRALRVRSRSQTADQSGLVFEPGALQASDMQEAQKTFKHAYFLGYTLRNHGSSFNDSDMRIYQIQIPVSDEELRVIGTVITDGEQNLVRYCIEDARSSNREIMRMSLEKLCTQKSVRFYNQNNQR